MKAVPFDIVQQHPAVDRINVHLFNKYNASLGHESEQHAASKDMLVPR